MNFIDEENPRNNICLSFFPPFRNFFVDLFSNFVGNLSSGSRKEGQETLRTGVDNIDFMESDSMNYLLSLLDLTLRTVDKSGLRTHSVVVWCSCEASACFGDLSWGFVDCYDISSDDFLFLDSFDHLLSQVIDSFHLCSFESDFASFGARS